MDGTVLEEKSSFKMLRLTFSSKLDWVSHIMCIAKTASRKVGALICSMKFLASEVALYLYKSTIRLCMEYCCYIWAGATWNCWVSYKNVYAGVLVFHLLIMFSDYKMPHGVALVIQLLMLVTFQYIDGQILRH